MDNVTQFVDMTADQQAVFEAMTPEQRSLYLNPGVGDSDFANMTAEQQAVFEASNRGGGVTSMSWAVLGLVLVGLVLVSNSGGGRRR